MVLTAIKLNILNAETTDDGNVAAAIVVAKMLFDATEAVTPEPNTAEPAELVAETAPFKTET